MKNTETKHHIEIEGVILTEAGIKYLKAIQTGDNELISCNRETIADVICFLAKCMDYMPDTDSDEVSLLMSGLSYLRNDLNKLRKP